MTTRDEIENAIKEHGIDRADFHEASKLIYAEIIRKIEDTFVDKRDYREGIHWANMGRYKTHLPLEYRNDQGNTGTFLDNLIKIIPAGEELLWLLVEDTKGYEPKYWLYEGTIEAIILLLKETSFNDFYIVSRKFIWLLSQNHHDIWSFVGEGFRLECLNDPE